MMGVKDMLPTPNFGAANPLFRNPAEALPSPPARLPPLRLSWLLR